MNNYQRKWAPTVKYGAAVATLVMLGFTYYAHRLGDTGGADVLFGVFAAFFAFASALATSDLRRYAAEQRARARR